MAEGYIYILLNPSLKGQVKIGRTADSPEGRAAELSSTGLPHDFVVAYAEKVSDCETVERLLHERFSVHRVSPKREFFRITAHEAVRAAIELAMEYPADVPAPGPEPVPAGRMIVEAPMVGTFYRASSPGAEPYVSVGDLVKEGQTLCIIEAMKLMNEIDARVAGRVAGILVENSQPVEYGQPLFHIDPA
jgi:acetyl-CoA carboxylase biotin carboxyl carrier protein